MRVLAHKRVQLMYKPWKIRLKLLDKDFFVCTNHENFLEGFFYTNSFTENFSMYVQTMKIFECDLEGNPTFYVVDFDLSGVSPLH